MAGSTTYRVVLANGTEFTFSSLPDFVEVVESAVTVREENGDLVMVIGLHNLATIRIES